MPSPQPPVGATDTRRTLAILGGTPAFPLPLHVGRPNMGDRTALMRRIDDMLNRCWLTNDGPLVIEFERHIAKFIGVKHCIAMCNATVALEISIRALELHGEVIVPAYTFVATAHALQWQEITPVFADMDPATHLIDPAQVERLITPRTTGIIGVHLWGRGCATDDLEAIGRKRNLKVMYDAAHAFGCTHGGRLIGSFGSCEVFSFHATKFLNSFEGGAIVTNDDALAAKMRLMRNFGFSGYDRVNYIGTNGKMTEVCAAMGLTSLESMDAIVAINRRNHQAYATELRALSGTRLLAYSDGERSNYQYIVVEIDPAVYPLSRDELIQVLHAENILARKYFWPGVHQMEPYRSFFPNARLMLPVTERVAARVIVLPTGQAVGVADITRICQVLQHAATHAGAVKQALPRVP